MRLTPRQVDVLETLVDGGPGSNEYIAQKLVISRATVKQHLNAIMKDTGIKTRTQLAVWWIRAALTTPAQETP